MSRFSFSFLSICEPVRSLGFPTFVTSCRETLSARGFRLYIKRQQLINQPSFPPTNTDDNRPPAPPDKQRPPKAFSPTHPLNIPSGPNKTTLHPVHTPFCFRLPYLLSQKAVSCFCHTGPARASRHRSNNRQRPPVQGNDIAAPPGYDSIPRTPARPKDRRKQQSTETVPPQPIHRGMPMVARQHAVPSVI
jgi:hypothetical protein